MILISSYRLSTAYGLDSLSQVHLILILNEGVLGSAIHREDYFSDTPHARLNLPYPLLRSLEDKYNSPAAIHITYNSA